MKNLKDYLNEGLISRKVSIKTPIRYRPTSKTELQMFIINLLKNGQTNLNCIDVSNIKYFGWLFNEINNRVTVKDIDISEWDVSNVTNMECMFAECDEFNSDISNWNVSNVKNMSYMFRGCKKFKADLSNWDVSNVANMKYMFFGCTTLRKNKLIPDWR